MKKTFLFYIALIMLLGGYGCKKSLLDVSSPTAYSFDTYFVTPTQINQATIATYAVLLHPGMWAREYYFILDFLGNDAKRSAALQGDINPISDYTFAPSNPILTQLWSSLYRMVFRANVVIDRSNILIPTSSTTDQAVLKQYIAEAKYLRAYANMQLVSLWGRVPLRTSYQEVLNNFNQKRAETSEIWTAVENDLKEAAPDLPLPSDQNSADLGRATRGAAIALLGKAYLYQKKWTDAQTTLLQLTKPPYTYQPVSNYDDLFSTTNQSNTENIFQVMNSSNVSQGTTSYIYGGSETWGGKVTTSGRAREYGFNDFKNTYIADALVKAFKYQDESGATFTDPRARWIMYGDAASGAKTDYCSSCTTGPIAFPFTNMANNGPGGYRWRKYEIYDYVPAIGSSAPSGVNGQIMRYADVLLMIAETYIQNDQSSSAMPYINQVRGRVGAFQYTSLGDKTAAMNKLMLERRLELAGEQSRYFDLLRWGNIKETLNAELQAQYGTAPFQDKNILLPIPQQEKDTNPSVAGDVANNWN